MPPSHVSDGYSANFQIFQLLNCFHFQELLLDYPDQDLACRLLKGFTSGFSIGVEGEVGPGSFKNNASALIRSRAVSAAIARELLAGTLHGPFSSPPFPKWHCSPVTAVDKLDGSVRLILDMSSPKGDALNEYIDKDRFACHYSLFDNAVHMVREVGHGCFLAKLDVKNAFRLCPVKMEEWPLLCFKWSGKFYYYVALPFGSRSSPAIFNAFADVLCWLFQHKGGIKWVEHYLDDYLFAERSHVACSQIIHSAQGLCKFLNVPLASDKMVGPAQVVTYLGIEIDTLQFALKLPAEKLQKLNTLLAQWQLQPTCTKRELLSLIGSLSFACKVIKPGRTFLRRLIDLSTTGPTLESKIVLDYEARLDIQWWQQFLPRWNGQEKIQPPVFTAATWGLYTDASKLGMGGVYLNRWFSVAWPAAFHQKHINVLELVAITAAIFLWGREWEDMDVVIYTDNKPVTDIWLSGSTKNKDMMSLLRNVFFFLARQNTNVRLEHVYGYRNNKADYLSRLQVTRFKAISENACDDPDIVPDEIWRILNASDTCTSLPL